MDLYKAHYLSLFLLFFTAMLTSCNKPVYEKEYTIENSAWSYEDSLEFGFEISDTLIPYSILLEINHSPDYRFQNLYVQMHSRFPSGKMEKQLVSLEMANAGGVLLSKCSGKKCTLEIPIVEKTLFREAGTYMLTIEQYMRQDPIAGLNSLKLSLIKEKKTKG